ncbi:MAG: putative quinol monooxygenase [Thiolinea sp.]
MYARVTTLGIKPEDLVAGDVLSAKIIPDVMAIPGIKHFFRGRDDAGNSIVVAIYESRDAAEAATETVKELFGKFAPYMSSPPVPAGYDIYDHGSNP